MAIPFDSIPAANRVPFIFIEFNNAGANQGSAVKFFQGLMLGQKTSAGTATANVPVTVTSEAQAKTLFGAGSELHLACKAWFANNKFTALKVIPLDDAGAGTAGTKTLTLGGTSAEAGTFPLYIGGVSVPVAVTNNMAAAGLATAIVNAVNANTDLPFTASAVSSTVTLTAKNKGTVGNEVDVRLGYYSADKVPAGLTASVATGVTGATNPSLTNAIAAMAGVHYDVIVNPYLDDTSLAALLAEMASRWGPMVQKEGVLFSAKDDTLANMQTWGLAKNSQFLTVLDLYKSPTPAFMVGAAYAAVAAFYLAIDPARPLQTLPLAGVLAPAETERRTMTEQNTLLFSGIATTEVDSAGTVSIQRAITTYQKTNGAADASYLDITTIYTLAYLRYDLRTLLRTKFPRHKLAGDGTKFGPGQAILTPKAAKAEIIARARLWEENGLVEGIDAFKAALIVERNTSDANRLDIMLSPDLVNGFVVCGVQFKFLV